MGSLFSVYQPDISILLNTMKICQSIFSLLFVIKAIQADLAEDLKRNGLTTLLDLVVKADLAETLGSVEPATIFAPTNEAFEAVPQATLNALLNNKQFLKDTLLDHVIPNAAIMSKDLKADNKVDSAGGNLLRITVEKSNGLTRMAVNGVQIRRVDVKAGSGSVVHIVQRVIPTVKKSDNVAAVVSSDPQFSTLLAAVQAAGLANALSSTDPITVFAPTNDAFAKIPEATLQAILADKDLLTSILTRHVVPKTIFSKPARYGPKTAHQTLNPKAKLITDKDPYLYNLRVGSFQQGQKHKRAMAVKTDILASNGVIHAIDTVI